MSDYNGDNDDEWSELFINSSLGEYDDDDNDDNKGNGTSTQRQRTVKLWRISIRIVKGSEIQQVTTAVKNTRSKTGIDPPPSNNSQNFRHRLGQHNEFYAVFDGPHTTGRSLYIYSERRLIELVRHLQKSGRPIILSLTNVLSTSRGRHIFPFERRDKLWDTVRVLIDNVKNQIEAISMPSHKYPLWLEDDLFAKSSSLRHVTFGLNVELLRYQHMLESVYMLPTPALSLCSTNHVSIELEQIYPDSQFPNALRDELNQSVATLLTTAPGPQIMELAFMPLYNIGPSYSSCFSMETIHSILMCHPRVKQCQPISLILKGIRIALPSDMKLLSDGISGSSTLQDLQLHLCDLESDEDKYRQLFAAIASSTSIEKFGLTYRGTMNMSSGLCLYQMLLQKRLDTVLLVRKCAPAMLSAQNPDYGAYALMKALLASYHLQQGGLMKLQHLHLGCPTMDCFSIQAFANFDHELCTLCCCRNVVVGDSNVLNSPAHCQYVHSTSSWRPRGCDPPIEDDDQHDYMTVESLLHQALRNANCCLTFLDMSGSGYHYDSSPWLLSQVLPPTTTLISLVIHGIVSYDAAAAEDHAIILDRRIEHAVDLVARCPSIMNVSIEKGTPCLNKRLEMYLRFNARRNAIQNPCQSKEDIICVLDECIDDVTLLFETLRLAPFLCL